MDNFKKYFDEFDLQIVDYILADPAKIKCNNIWRDDPESSPVRINETWLNQFYMNFKDWGIKWYSPMIQNFEGTVNILPIEKVLDWKAWDLMSEEFPQMENFTILDHFYNEAAVGFYLGAPEKGLYYFAFDADPKPINLDFKGYLEMIKYTKGAAYWQLACIEPIDKTHCKTVEKLNQLDSSITVEVFYKLFEEVRVK